MPCCNNNSKNALYLLPLILLLVLGVLAANFPELRRYLRIERM